MNPNITKYLFTIIFFFIVKSLFAQTVTYTYDNLGRLTMAKYPDNSTINYTYDAAGNRATVKITNTNYRAKQNIAFNAIGNKTYGTVDFDPAATASSKLPLTYLSATPAVATIVNGKLHITGTGTTVISAFQNGNSSFLPSDTVKQILTVTQAVLTVKANDQTKIFGAVNPKLTIKYTGFIAGEDSTKLSLLPVAVSTAVANSPPGTYPITVSGGAAANYIFTYVSGTLTVGNSNDASLTALTLSDGTLSPAFFAGIAGYTANVANAVNSITITPITGSGFASVKVNGTRIGSVSGAIVVPLDIGANNVAIVVNAQDGITTKTYTLSISRAKGDQVIIFQPLTVVTYGNKDITPAVTSTGGNKITFTSSNTTVAAITAAGTIHIAGAGTVTITATQSGDANANAATPVTQALSVNPAVLTITANNAGKISGTANPVLTVNYSGFVYGEDSTQLSTMPIVATSALLSSPAGSYPITVSGAASGNYTFNYVTGILTVKPIPAAVITSFSPATAKTGTMVTITGTDFTGATAVSFGGMPATSFTVISPTSITAIVGTGSSGDLSVTTPGGTTKATGFNFIFSLPATNFKIAGTSVTCKGSNNGALTIDAAQNMNYTATFTGPGLNNKTYPFTTTVTVGDLTPGTYNVCITIAGQTDYQQCFTSVITEPKDLSLYSTVLRNTNQVVLSLNGAETYNINLNGLMTTTTDNQLTMTLKAGVNTISVSSELPCQGTVTRTIIITDQLVPFPNPFNNVINVNLGNDIVKQADLTLYDTNNRAVYSKTFKNSSGVVQLAVPGFNLGVYFLKLSADGRETMFKMISK